MTFNVTEPLKNILLKDHSPLHPVKCNFCNGFNQ